MQVENVTIEDVTTRAGVLQWPTQAAEFLNDNPPGSEHTKITDAVLGTRAGVQRYPEIAANYLLKLSMGIPSTTLNIIPQLPPTNE